MYDYKEGKKRIEGIINSAIPIEKVSKVPVDDKFTYENGIKAWITSVFIDIRNSTEIFQKQPERDVSKIIRAFSSEMIEIMKSVDTYREIGIRGDCVYAIYSTPTKEAINQVMDEVVINMNTLMKMLNQLLKNKGIKTITAGIGVASSEDLIIKVGRKGTGINDKVWIGNSVITACNLANVALKSVNNPIVISNTVYDNIIDIDEEWKKYRNDEHYNYKSYITMNVVKTKFNEWVNNGMSDT